MLLLNYAWNKRYSRNSCNISVPPSYSVTFQHLEPDSGHLVSYVSYLSLSLSLSSCRFTESQSNMLLVHLCYRISGVDNIILWIGDTMAAAILYSLHIYGLPCPETPIPLHKFRIRESRTEILNFVTITVLLIWKWNAVEYILFILQVLL